MPFKLLYPTPVAPGDRLGSTTEFISGPGTHVKATDGLDGCQEGSWSIHGSGCNVVRKRDDGSQVNGFICASIMGYAVYLEPPETLPLVDTGVASTGACPGSKHISSGKVCGHKGNEAGTAAPKKALMSVALPSRSIAHLTHPLRVDNETPTNTTDDADYQADCNRSSTIKCGTNNATDNGPLTWTLGDWPSGEGITLGEPPELDRFLVNAKFLTGASVPTVGSKIWGQVVHISSKLVLVDILMSCGDERLTRPVVYSNPFRGIIRTTDIRSYRVDMVRPSECFRVGDIILAYTISTCDSRGSLLLTTAPSDCGVAQARSRKSGDLIPISFACMKCPISGMLEPRKVAHIASNPLLQS